MRIEEVPVIQQPDYSLRLTYRELGLLGDFVTSAIQHLAMSQNLREFGLELEAKINAYIPF